MDRLTAIFVDGLGAAAATSGILTQMQGRIFALLYLRSGPLSLDEIAAELQQSKSNISVTIRGLLEWHLARRVRVGGSRKDHYEAATNFWRVMQEVMERRFRWTVRQVIATVAETQRGFAATPESASARERKGFAIPRLEALGAFFSAVDVGIAAFTQGKPFAPQMLQRPLRAVAREHAKG